MSDEQVSYNEKVGRSWNLFDLKNVLEVANAVKPLERLPLGDTSITVLDDTGSYTVGEIWWDPESERWLFDPTKYGEA